MEGNNLSSIAMNDSIFSHSGIRPATMRSSSLRSLGFEQLRKGESLGWGNSTDLRVHVAPPQVLEISFRDSLSLSFALFPHQTLFFVEKTSFVYSHTPFGLLRAISSPSFWRIVRSFITFSFWIYLLYFSGGWLEVYWYNWKACG